MALQLDYSEEDLLAFIYDFREYFLDHRLVIYDLGMSKKQKAIVSIDFEFSCIFDNFG